MVALFLAALFTSAPCRAVANEVVIEVDAAAERLLDARATRRLVALELADIEVPKRARAETALFYRVLGEGRGLLRIELWERGELHNARVVSTAEGSPHLVARRVALAAAELARGLRQKRIAEARREAREKRRRRLAERARREATREGPVAVRAGFFAGYGDGLTLFGESLALELSLHGPLRLDLGARLTGAGDSRSPGTLGAFELVLGPARRFVLNPSLDLDVAALIAPMLVHVTRARAVDAVPDVRETWTARGGLAVRLEPRLSRSLRASIGFEGSLLLRTVLAEFDASEERRYRGFWLGAELGLVVTP